MKGGTQAATSGGDSSYVNQKWVQRGNGPKLLAPIISNKNLTIMINVTSA